MRCSIDALLNKQHIGLGEGLAIRSWRGNQRQCLPHEPTFASETPNGKNGPDDGPPITLRDRKLAAAHAAPKLWASGSTC